MSARVVGLRFEMALMESDARMANLKSTVCERVVDVCGGTLGRHLSAIILTGSMARGEATGIREGQVTRVLGDAEFFLVFNEPASLPSDALVNFLSDKIESQLGHGGVLCSIELTPVHSCYFQSLQPTIFSYELRACGQVVWGDPSVLSLIPPFSAADIPRQDAWRLLLNRMIECLEVAPDFLQSKDRVTERLLYRVVKLRLDMASSFLVFTDEFRPTYRGRAQALQQMAEQSEVMKKFPLELHSFSRQVMACTEFKLQSGREHPFLQEAAGSEEDVECLRVVTDAISLWRWELAQLSGMRPTAADRELMERWMCRQALSRRLRGWLVVLRACGWHRSWRNWARWIRLARRASPRNWVYAAASELFFSLPGLLTSALAERSGRSVLPPTTPTFAPLVQETGGSQGNSAWTQWTFVLPIIPQSPPKTNSHDWVVLALGIAANYHKFLEHTES